MAKELTHPEKAAIYYHIVGKCEDWAQLYKIAKGNEAYDGLAEASRPAMVSRWKLSDHIQTAIKETTYLLQREREEADRKAVEAFKENQENPQSEGNLSDVNFLDRDEFLAYLNKQANRIQDEKSRNETLKMISDNLRFKDMERESGNDQETHRFYTPITCQECELYKRCQVCPLDKCPNVE